MFGTVLGENYLACFEANQEDLPRLKGADRCAPEFERALYRKFCKKGAWNEISLK